MVGTNSPAREQLTHNDVATLKGEMDAGRRPKWRGFSVWGFIWKSCWSQWESLAVRDGVLKRHWESADRKKTAQIVILRSKV